MSFPFLRTSLALGLTLASSTLLANGLALNEQSASGAGTAYAGRASSALDASTIFGNPAGLSKLKGKQLSGGFAVVKANVDISRVDSNAPGTNKGDMVPLANVPFAFFSTEIVKHIRCFFCQLNETTLFAKSTNLQRRITLIFQLKWNLKKR